MISRSGFFLRKASGLMLAVSPDTVEEIVDRLERVRAAQGRVFCLGNGGGAAIASHAVNDLRKICRIEAYAPHDNYPEISARINDDGYEQSLVDSLKISRLSTSDALFIFSVGGGSPRTSANLAAALAYARFLPAAVLAIVGSNGGMAAQNPSPNDVVLRLPTDKTPYVEGLQGMLLHAIVFNPRLCKHD